MSRPNIKWKEEDKKRMKAKTFRIMSFSIAAFLVVLVVAISVACGLFANMITLRLSTKKLGSAERQFGENLATQIEEEGVVMTKNDNKTLPLDKDKHGKVNVFGWASTQWIMGGSGSGRSVNSSQGYTPDVDFLKALSDYGIEYNQKLISMYKSFQGSRPFWYDTLHTHDYESCRLFEPSIDDKSRYTDELLNDAKQFSDVAIVVLGRAAGESNDAPTVQYKNYASKGKVPAANTDKTRTFLDISTEEEALLTYVGKTYDKVIVVINSTNTMNLGFMDKIDGLDSCLIVGGTGNKAANALPRVIYGEVSPSGRTVDTYAYDFSTAATYANSGMPGVGTYNNTTNLYPATGTNPNVGESDNKYPGVNYLDYTENIYVGYMWYETADAEGFWTSDYAKNKWGVNGYKDVVQYPFGYGLSYTQFKTDVIDVSPKAGSELNKNSKITVKVSVYNDGPVAGQHVVQLYFAPEYHRDGGLEKPSVMLAAFAKTPVAVEPGKAQELTLEFEVSDMATYDCYGKKIDGGAYVLEAGKYQVRIMDDSHNLTEVRSGSATIDYRIGSDIIYDVDPTSGKEVKNRFTGEKLTDGFAVDGTTSGEDIKYMTRADFETSFPAERVANRDMAAELKAKVLYTKADAQEWAERHADAKMPVMGSGGNLRPFNGKKATELGLELGADYLDPRWEQVLDQIKSSELDDLVLHGYVQEVEIATVGKDKTSSVDGPSQIGSFNQIPGTGFPMPTVLAQSFNVELARSFGLAVGAEAQAMGYSGWYAPGINMHRSPFGGRNYEYYSEDPMLTGLIAAGVSKGSLQTGTYLYAKHMIGYDQESYRDGLYCWMTEQTLRDVYLKPFKIAMDKGGLTGVMTAYGRIGAVWSGGSEALLTDLLRDEWGFNGAVLTDYADHHNFMNGDQMIRAGGDLWMDGWFSNGSFKQEKTSAAFRQAERDAAHHVLYMILNAAYIHSNYDPSADGITISSSDIDGGWWLPVLIVGDILIVGGAATLVVFGILRKDKKKAAAAEASESAEANKDEETPDTEA